jgi:hypothetical protein
MTLHRRKPSRNMGRFGSVYGERDLFGLLVLLSHWGRSGPRAWCSRPLTGITTPRTTARATSWRCARGAISSTTARSTVAGAGSLCSGVRHWATCSSAATAHEREGNEGTWRVRAEMNVPWRTALALIRRRWPRSEWCEGGATLLPCRLPSSACQRRRSSRRICGLWMGGRTSLALRPGDLGVQEGAGHRVG